MERINYRITLDTHKNGIQRTLQGFETSDKMSRRIAINLVAGGDTYEIPLDNIVAIMYVITPNAAEPSIHDCTIDNNTIIYDVHPITEEGITEMQIKLIEIGVNGAKKVLIAPRFAVEVSNSNADDENIEKNETFTALEDAIAKAESFYNSRLERIEIDTDCTFRVHYADGTVYENDSLNKALYNGNALLSESWAKGGTGIREGEETNNSMYYSNVSRSASADANVVAEDARGLLNEAVKMTSFTSFLVDFENGNLEYMSQNSTFDVDEETGDLTYELESDYDPESLVGAVVDEYLEKESAELNTKVDEAVSIAKGKNQAHVFATTEEMNVWLSDLTNKGICTIGDNLYIKELDVPDWWISKILDVADSETGFYYEISQLETQKVDLSSIPKSLSVKNIELVTELPDNGEEGTVYLTYEVVS